MLELEQLGERILPSAMPPGPPPALASANQALDVYEAFTGNKALREQLDTEAGQVRGWLAAAQGVLQPARAALMQAFLANYVQAPQPTLVNPSYAIPPGRQTVYYVNGILTTPDEALAEAQALADQLGRPVGLIYNTTEGTAGDVLQTVGDLAWFPPLPQPDPTARELAGLLLSAHQAGQTVDLVAYSRGAATANDALLAVSALGLGPWAYANVAVVSVAAPLGPFQADGTAHFQRLDNIGDPVVEFLGDRRGSLLAKLDPTLYDLPVSVEDHFFANYVGQITIAALF
jgi:hypothetical protein